MAFERLAGFVAIRQTQADEEVLRQLILHVLTMAGTSLANAAAVATQVDELCGLRISEPRIQAAVDQLQVKGELARERGGALTVTAGSRAAVLKRIEDARGLERRVREQWLAAMKATHPDLDEGQAWSALEAYLTNAFQQHGLQTIALLDPNFEVPEEYQASLRSMLDGALAKHCDEGQRENVSQAIVAFMLTAGTDADRSAFIARLADCTVSYFSLTVPPDVAAQLRAKLKPLMVFLDTNVLFGLIGLDDRPVVHVSHELVEIVTNEQLPIRLRYHATTESELRTTFDTTTARLRGVTWSPHVSRSAAKSMRVSTIQRLYHEANAERAVTAETFFKPYLHLDVLLQDKGITLYREPSTVDKQRIYDLMADYAAFLESHHRAKPYEAIEHDMTLLDCVRRLRSNAKSSLEAQALCVTTDYLLWKFDRRQSKQKGNLPTMILAPQLMQLLRPFVPITRDFDQSFADSFAIPAFRALGDGANAATGRMLEIIASYENIAEETVESLLANDLFLDGLAHKKESELREYVESAIASENDRLARERFEFAEQLKTEKREREEIIRNERAVIEGQANAKVSEAAQIAAQEGEKGARAIDSAQEALARAESQGTRAALAESRAEAAEAERDRLRHDEATRVAEEGRRKVARQRSRRLMGGVGIGLGAIAVTEVLVHLAKFDWLLSHPHTLGLRGATYLVVLCVGVALTRRDLGLRVLSVAAVGALYVVLQLVDRPPVQGQESPAPRNVQPKAVVEGVPKGKPKGDTTRAHSDSTATAK